MYKFIYFVWALFVMPSISIDSEYLNPKDYEQLAKNRVYDPVCLIQSYDRQGALSEFATGVLVSHSSNPSQRCVLSTSHLRNTNSLTVTFNDKIERKVILYRPFIQIPQTERINYFQLELMEYFLWFYKGIDFSLIFLKDYPQDISPASIASLEFPGGIPPKNDEELQFLTKYTLSKLKDLEAHVAGFGYVITPDSRPKYVTAYGSKENIKTAFTLKVSYSPAFDGTGYRLNSIYKTPRTQGATSYELPLRPAFSGGPLFDSNNQIIGLVSHTTKYFDTPAFKNDYPKLSRFMSYMPKIAKFLMLHNKSWYYSLPVFFTHTVAASYIESSLLYWLTIASGGVNAVIAHQLPWCALVYKAIIEYLFLPGDISYFSYIPVWKSDINVIIGKYYTELKTMEKK